MTPAERKLLVEIGRALSSLILNHRTRDNLLKAVDAVIVETGERKPISRDHFQTVNCDADCPKKRESWPGCCKLAIRCDALMASESTAGAMRQCGAIITDGLCVNGHQQGPR